MKITLTDDAIQWFENKFPLDEGEAIRFFGKTYGNTEVHEGFSLGLEMDNPDDYSDEDIVGLARENNRQYFTTKEDNWFFSGYDLEIDIDDNYNEPEYHFNSQNPENETDITDAASGASEKDQ